MTGITVDVGRNVHGRRAAVAAALGVIALVIAALAQYTIEGAKVGNTVAQVSN